jgi:ligand-binding SRPBCC domain-containing protein
VTTLHHRIRIDAPIGDVWKAVSDLVAVAAYNPLVKSAKCLSGGLEGVGAARRCELQPSGWVEERVWAFEPPRAIGFEVAASEWPIVFMRWKTELAEDGEATVVTQQMSYKLKLGPLGALLDAIVMRRKLDRSVRDVFEGLRRYVEGRRARDGEAARPEATRASS